MTILRIGLFCLAALFVVAEPARAADGWRVCAQEGGTCRMSERGVVRYGTNGLWASRTVSGEVECSNQVFGDPAPQARKRCEVRDYGGSGGSGGSGSKGWVFCAAEGELCTFKGSSEVRFGADRNYTTRRAYNSVRCDVSAFGDPIYGTTKHCEVRAEAALPGGGGGGWGGSGGSWEGGGWRYCAPEGQTCNVNGRAQVRYGDGRRFATRTVNGSVRCGNATFGDPAQGQIKHCEVKADGSGGGAGGGWGGGWTKCADEGLICQIDGERVQVRYGAAGRYVYLDTYQSVNCVTESFGRDPYFGKLKSCEVNR